MTININQVTNVFCGSGLARDSGDAVFLEDRGDAITSKPAPHMAIQKKSRLPKRRSGFAR